MQDINDPAMRVGLIKLALIGAASLAGFLISSSDVLSFDTKLICFTEAACPEVKDAKIVC